MNPRGFLARALDKRNREVVLRFQDLKYQEQGLVTTGMIKPHDVREQHFRKELFNQIENQKILERFNARVVFEYKGKKHLIIYNKPWEHTA